MIWRVFSVLLLSAQLLLPAFAQNRLFPSAAAPEIQNDLETKLPPPVRYKVSLFKPEQHLLHIELDVPPGGPEQNLQLPVWNALYQVRDFSQYLNWLRATTSDGRPLEVQKVNKSCWRIFGNNAGAHVEYEIYADSPGPFGAQLDGHHSFLNLAQVLLYPVELRSGAVAISFNVPAGWSIATPLPVSSGGGFHAENYDRLVDSPVEIGKFREADFDEAGGHYRVIIDADPADYDMEKLTSNLHRIVSAATTWMDDRPFETYMFLYHFPRGPAGGGMEHAYSTAIAVNAEVLARSSQALTSVTAHEFFHLWNVKRIRPQTLEPIDYTRENFTRALWFSEGCTSTAADFIQLRAGLMDGRRFEEEVASAIAELQRRPAHLTQSAEESSLDAWLEGDAYYRRPERSISYYNKGELLGITLDLAIREASHGESSLREVFQWMNENYAKKGRFFADSDGVREAAEAVTRADLGWFFSRYVKGREEIPWNDFFRIVGLRLVTIKTTAPDPGFIASRNFDGPMGVEAVSPGSEADRAGLQVGDTILEINGAMVGRQSSDTLAAQSPGDTIRVKIRPRRGAERELKLKIGSREEISYDLQDVDDITAEQRTRRAAWLKGEARISDSH